MIVTVISGALGLDLASVVSDQKVMGGALGEIYRNEQYREVRLTASSPWFHFCSPKVVYHEI
jgi:hypothetical protein